MAKHKNYTSKAILVVWAILLVATRMVVSTSATTIIDAETGKECVDTNPTNCPYWAQIGECKANPGYMHVHCKKSCDRCHITRVKDRDEINKIIAQRKKEFAERKEEYRKNKEENNNKIEKPSTTTTATASISSTGEVETVEKGTRTAMDGNQGSSSPPTTLSSSSTTKPKKKKTIMDAMTGLECVDLDANCPFWAATGDCLNNKSFMSTNCRLSCDRCHIVRVNNPDEIAKFIERKNKETEHIRQAQKQQREINKILQGGEF